MEILVMLLLIGAAAVGQMLLYAGRVFRHLEYSCQLSREEAEEGEEIEILETVVNRKWLPLLGLPFPILKRNLTPPPDPRPHSQNRTPAGHG